MGSDNDSLHIKEAAGAVVPNAYHAKLVPSFKAKFIRIFPLQNFKY